MFKLNRVHGKFVIAIFASIGANFSHAKELEIALPNEFSITNNNSAFCLAAVIFKRMNLTIKPVPMLLIRTAKEAQKGTVALTFVNEFTFAGKKYQVIKPKGLIVSKMPFAYSKVNIYGKGKQNLPSNWFSLYRIGVTRKELFLEDQEAKVNYPENIQQVPSLTNAVSLLEKKRLDLIISSELYAEYTKQQLATPEQKALLTKQMAIGNTLYFMSFSEKYLGSSYAQSLASEYDHHYNALQPNDYQHCSMALTLNKLSYLQ